MSKSLTLTDLTRALKPLLDAIASNGMQISEMHPMLTDLHTKMDLLDQNNEESEEEPVKKVAKKKVVKKVLPKKRAAKKPAKRGIKTVDEPEPEPEPEPESASGSEDESGSDDEVVETKKPVKLVKTTKKPKKTKVVKKPRLPNKMEYFNIMFDEDEDYFSTYITGDDVEQINADNEDKWEGLEGEPLRKARRTAYYHFMKDNHDNTLKIMKSAYHEEITNKPAKIVAKE